MPSSEDDMEFQEYLRAIKEQTGVIEKIAETQSVNAEIGRKILKRQKKILWYITIDTLIVAAVLGGIVLFLHYY